MENTELRILGIDPGTTIMGFGLIASDNKGTKIILADDLLLKKYTSHVLKLKLIFEKTLYFIDQYHPDEIAIEAPFYGKNAQSMLKLGRAQGVAMAAGLYRNIPIAEYSPKKIKQSITGKGNASKEQVARMLESILNIDLTNKNLDSTDGLATAICHFYNRNNPNLNNKYSGWEGFVKQNPDTII